MIKSQLSYCPLIWISSLKYKNLIKKSYGKSLRLITNDENMSFETLQILKSTKEIHKS